MNPIVSPKRLLVAGAVAGSLVTGIALGATTLAPTLASAASTPAPAGSPAPGGAAGTMPAMPAHGSPEHEGAEVAVTGSNATQAQAAAVKALGGGTAGAVTSDFTKSGYEVTVTKSDGTTTEVHLDSSFNVLQGHPGPGAPPR